MSLEILPLDIASRIIYEAGNIGDCACVNRFWRVAAANVYQIVCNMLKESEQLRNWYPTKDGLSTKERVITTFTQYSIYCRKIDPQAIQVFQSSKFPDISMLEILEEDVCRNRFFEDLTTASRRCGAEFFMDLLPIFARAGSLSGEEFFARKTLYIRNWTEELEKQVPKLSPSAKSTLLIWAARNRQEALMKLLLPDLKTAENDERKLLASMLATHAEAPLGIIQLLLNDTVDIYSDDPDLESPVDLSGDLNELICAKGRLDITQWMSERNIFDYSEEEISMSMSVIAGEGHLKLLDWYFKNDILQKKPDQLQICYKTATERYRINVMTYCHAYLHKDEKTIQFLLACESGQTSSVEDMLRNRIDEKFFRGACYTAILNGHFDIAKLFIDTITNPSEVNAELFGAIYCAAAESGNIDIVRLLQKKFEFYEKFKNTALKIAIQQNHVHLVELFVSQGLSQQARDEGVKTALKDNSYYQAEVNIKYMLQLLMQGGDISDELKVLLTEQSSQNTPLAKILADYRYILRF